MNKINLQFTLKTFVLLLLLFLISDLFSQNKIKVTATGSYEARDLTLDEVKKRAIDEAKHNAMLKAGILENVSVSNVLYTIEDGKQFKDIFQSYISTETEAEIIVEEIRELKRDINEYGNILIEVEIDALIIKHNEKNDPAFSFEIAGIREFYYENDPLNFSFTPTRDGYLTVFNISKEAAFLLYPYSDPDYPALNDELDKIFSKNKEVIFPINSRIDSYYFSIDSKSESDEYNLLIFVYTKENYLYLKEVNIENIMRWIFDIPLDERTVEQFGIVVKR